MGQCILVENNILLDEVSEILKEGKQVVIIAKGNSMLPYMRNEIDSVVLQKNSEIKLRDVVLAKVPFGPNNKKYILHRIIAIDGNNVTLMGDGNCRGVEHCTLDDISGTAIRIIRPNGKEVKISNGRLWSALLPIRPYILAAYHKIQKLKRKK